MNILVACEESQAVTIELRKMGHKSYSCDIEPCSGGHPEWHIQADVLPLLNGRCEFQTMDGVVHAISDRWDMLIAFPPCTYLSNAGACRLYPKKGVLNQDRYQKGLEGKEFFLKFLNADCDKIAVENPVSSKVFQMPIHTQEIQPYQFDDENEHPYTKKTRLWLRGMNPLVPTTPKNKPIAPYIPSGTSRKDTAKYGRATRTGKDAKIRSKTFPGIARAMAAQWAAKEQNNG